ncbi:amidohydrolase family protein [Pontibacter rugosus]|uniref:Amidohydrolase family protein n=1 Tax=Pontibacter rugosus TaxID=1745966 RepID=A0ABW3SS71_9BACT
MRILLPLLLSLSLLLSACQTTKKETYDLLITNATIVDISTGKLIQDQVIAISNDTIRVVDATANARKYKAQQTLDASGKYVMPGLWDMHVHFRGGDTLIEENKNFLPLFLAYGVTTVRDAGGDIVPSVLSWREQIRKGALVGPTIFTPGPKLDGPNPAWPGSIQVVDDGDIAAALDSLESLDVDYVKMYDGSLSKEAFYGIIQAAEKRGLKTTGHMPLSADILQAVDYGLDGSEHMYYVLKATSPLADSLTSLNLGYGMMGQIVNSYNPKLAQQVIAKLSANNVYITPTLHISKTLAEILDTDHTKDSLLAYIGSGVQQTYQGRIESAKRARTSGNDMRQQMAQLVQDMMVPMYEAGVNIVAGSDSGPYNSFVYPGESLHGELNSLVNAGLSPQQALTTSVINGPKFFGIDKFYGGVEQGKVADLLILDGNPLEEISNSSRINSVIKSAKVYHRKALDKMLSDLK